MKQLVIFFWLIGLVTAVVAAPVPYAGTGANTVDYSFWATGNGPITAYFVGGDANFGSKIGLSINGATPVFSAYGLPNHEGSGSSWLPTVYGTTFNMGTVNAGDIFRFVLAVDRDFPGGPVVAGDVDFYLNSDPSLNLNNDHHIYSSVYGGDEVIPAGIYVGFEDYSPLSGSDTDYNDHQFVFTGATAVPEPTTFSLVALGFGALTMLRHQRHIA